jgi:hypothetical protein
MKIETTNALDAAITIDEPTSSVTVKYTSLRGTFSKAVSLDTTTTPNGIVINITKTGSGTANTVTIDLKRYISSGTYGSVKVATIVSGVTPTPTNKMSKTFTF